METYIYLRHNTVVQYIATGPNMDLCLASKQRPGPSVAMRWWEQEGLNLERMRTVSQEAEHREGVEETYGTETATDD